MADEPAATKRVELIDQGDPTTSGLPGYIGLGLIVGFILGFGPLRDAVQGVGPFEDAMVRFLSCVLFCVAAGSVLGRILDSAPPADDEPSTQPSAATAASGTAATAESTETGADNG